MAVPSICWKKRFRCRNCPDAFDDILLTQKHEPSDHGLVLYHVKTQDLAVFCKSLSVLQIAGFVVVFQDWQDQFPAQNSWQQRPFA